MTDGFGFIISLMVSYFSFAMFSFWAMYSMSHYGWNGVHGCGMFSHISTYNNAQLDIIFFIFIFIFIFSFYFPVGSDLMVSSRLQSQ
jgi:hypothetical protein